MYNIEVFEQLIKSNLSSEDVYEKIMEMNPIYTKKNIVMTKKNHLLSM